MLELVLASSTTASSTGEEERNTTTTTTTATKKKKSSHPEVVEIDFETKTKPVVLPPRSRSQTTSRRVTPTTTTIHFGPTTVEKHLSNGDLYTGSLSGNTPHGSGKYLWSDGCMYEGEWKRGKASGKGKFSWHSGATFEGDFKSGRMDGLGTYIGSDGHTYRGSWSGDCKHGYGLKHYSNGDYYEGTWKRNLQDGQGRYVWRNGNEYVGQWKNGVISGRGVLIWANNGNRYDGNWENGVPKGHGVFTWPDGSCYVGSWGKNSNPSSKNHQMLNGTFYLGANTVMKEEKFGFSNTLVTPLMDENSGLVVAKKRSSVDGSRGSMAERAFPRICIWESDGEASDITCDIIDNVEALMFYQDGSLLDCDNVRQFRRNPCCFTGEAKKPGQTIAKGHKNYDLMLNLQLGISMLRYYESLSQVILIQRRSSGQGFLLKDQRLRHPIQLWSSDGKIIVPWCSGAY